jgi:hypothetical protein
MIHREMIHREVIHRALAPLVLAILLFAAPARAGVLFGPGPGERLLQPPSQYFMPIEAGALDNHVDLQLVYTYFSLSVLGHSVDTHVAMLGAEGQIALFDRIQIGLNIPFLNHATAAVGSGVATDTEFGNMLLKLKVKIIGSSSGPFCLSAFLNTLFPTGSALKSHDFAGLHGGVGASFGISRFTLNADIAVYDLFGSKGNGLTGLLVDLHAAAKILFLAPYLALQLATPLDGIDTHTPGVALSAGLQFFPITWIHLDLGTRVALNDNAKLFYSALGRATLVFGAGFRF